MNIKASPIFLTLALDHSTFPVIPRHQSSRVQAVHVIGPSHVVYTETKTILSLFLSMKTITCNSGASIKVGTCKACLTS